MVTKRPHTTNTYMGCMPPAEYMVSSGLACGRHKDHPRLPFRPIDRATSGSTCFERGASRHETAVAARLGGEAD